MSFKLVHGLKVVPITMGGVLVGRSAVCKIVVDDMKVSRRHACVRLEGGQVVVDDLGSSNGVVVNGERVIGTLRVAPGDVIHVGSEVLQISGGDVAPPSDSGTPPDSAREISVEDDPPTHQVIDVLAVTTRMVEDVLHAGEVEKAERVAEPTLTRLLMKAKKMGPLPEEQETGAAKLALKIARATRRGGWVDYVFELYDKSRRTLPLDLVQELLWTMGELRLPATDAFTTYIEQLRDRRAELEREGREVLRRLERFLRAETTRTMH
jgi:hypothetical protein